MAKFIITFLIMFWRWEMAFCGVVALTYLFYMCNLTMFRPLREMEGRLDEIETFLKERS